MCVQEKQVKEYVRALEMLQPAWCALEFVIHAAQVLVEANL